MRSPTYLSLSRHNVFYFRWALPRPLRAAGVHRVIKVSLGTRDPAQALRLSRHFGYVAEVIVSRSMASGMRFDEIRDVLHKHFSAALEKRKADIAENGRLAAPVLALLRNTAELSADAVQNVIPLISEAFDDQGAEQFIKHYKLPIEPHSAEFKMLRTELRRAHAGYCHAVLAFDESLGQYNFGADLASSTPAIGAKPRSIPAVTLKELAQAFAQERRVGAIWSPKTEGERLEHIKLLFKILGEDFDVREIGDSEAMLVKKTLLKYPKNRSKDPRTRNLPLEQALEVKSVPKIHARTINKYLQTYSGMFGWAEDNKFVEKNRFKSLTVDLSERNASTRRAAFKAEQVRAILDELIGNSRGLIKKGHHKWGPLIGLYSGARLNEICQILLADIQKVEDIWCFSLTDEGDGQQLKNDASRRFVPIHPRLIELGLLSYVEELRTQRETRLFPLLSRDRKNGWGRRLSHWFNVVFLPALSLKSPELVFHSLRHTVATRLSQAGVAEPIVKQIVGHTQLGVLQQVYVAEGYKLHQLLEALRKLPY